MVQGGEEGGAEGVALEGGEGREEGYGDFAGLGERLEAGELAEDLVTRGAMGGGEEVFGVVDEDEADGFVLVEDFGDAAPIGGVGLAEGGILVVVVGAVILDILEDDDAGEIDAGGGESAADGEDGFPAGEEEDAGKFVVWAALGRRGKLGADAGGEGGEAGAGGSDDGGEAMAGKIVGQGPEDGEGCEVIERTYTERGRSGWLICAHGDPPEDWYDCFPGTKAVL